MKHENFYLNKYENEYFSKLRYLHRSLTQITSINVIAKLIYSVFMLGKEKYLRRRKFSRTVK